MASPDSTTDTHVERSALASRPCRAGDMTFGGRCLNCGYDPKAQREPACTCTQRLYGVNHGINCPLREML